MKRDELLQIAQSALTHVNNGVPYYAPEFHGAMLHSIACTLLAEAQRSETRSLTVEDVEKAMGEVLAGKVWKVSNIEDGMVLNQALRELRDAVLTRLRGG